MMHSYEELEKIYYKRKIIKYFTILGISLLIGMGGIIFYQSSDYSQKKLNRSNVKYKELKKESKKIISKSIKKELVLEFKLPQIEENNKLVKQHVLNKKTINNKKVEVSKISKVEINKTKRVYKKFPVIVEEKKITLKELIKNYESFPSYEKAIDIANLYLKKNKLKKAQEWALKANNINPSNYESWIIFAKILIKENKRKEAIKILNTYIQTYGDNENVIKFIRGIK